MKDKKGDLRSKQGVPELVSKRLVYPKNTVIKKRKTLCCHKFHLIRADFNSVHCYAVPFTAQHSFLRLAWLTGGYTTRPE